MLKGDENYLSISMPINKKRILKKMRKKMEILSFCIRKKLACRIGGRFREAGFSILKSKKKGLIKERKKNCLLAGVWALKSPPRRAEFRRARKNGS